MFFARLSTRVSNSDQPVLHTRKHYTNINCHNLHNYPSYVVTNTENFMTDKPDKIHRMVTYAHDGTEEPNDSGSKPILG